MTCSVNPWIDANHKTQVAQIIRGYLPNVRIWAFGSRVRGEAKPTSDLDIAVEMHEKIDLAVMAKIREALAETDIPYQIDLVDCQRVSGDFKAMIHCDATRW